ncbi:MAG: YARHG domain-containing protein [Firmicutes bacterium]|nr:YARHG domain-containing protein [Bacillota bacterium]
MFCVKCGYKLSPEDVFCNNCGAKRETDTVKNQSNVATPQGGGNYNINSAFFNGGNNTYTQNSPVAGNYNPYASTQNFYPQQKPKNKGVVIAVIVTVLVLLAAGGGAAAYFLLNKDADIKDVLSGSDKASVIDEVDLNEFVKAEFSGKDTEGEAKFSFDKVAFDKEYGEKITLNAKKARAITGEKDIKAADFIAYTLENNFEEGMTGLSNGDEIRFSWKDVSKVDIVNCTNIKNVVYSDVDFKVSGLDKLEEKDPFENIDVSFQGTEGTGKVLITNNNKSPLTDIKFDFSNDGTLKNGDVVKISISSKECEKYLKKGIKIIETEKDYTVSGLKEKVQETVTEVPVEESQPKYTEYILPESNSRYISKSELAGFNEQQLRIARNEIYARRGRRFNDASLQTYFNTCSWYNGTISPENFNEDVFNQYERSNLDLITEYESERGY